MARDLCNPARPSLPIGWPLMPVPDETGSLTWLDLDRSVRETIKSLLITRPGERLLHRNLGAALQEWLPENAGVTLGIGLGMESEDDPHAAGFFRIGHMGHVNSHMVLGTLATIETGMRALDIPFGSGALEAATTICAGG